MWRDVQQIPIQEGGESRRYQGQEGPRRERRGVGGGTARDRKLRAGLEGVLGVQVQEMEYMEVPEGTGKASGTGGRQGRWMCGSQGGGGGGAAALGGCADRVGGRESGPDATGQSGVAGARMEGKVQGGGEGTPVVGLAYDVASGPGGGLRVRNEWGGELPGGGHEASSVRAQFTGAALTPVPTTQGHRGQRLVYTF